MAVQAVVFVAGKLSDLLIQEATLLGGVRDDIEFMERELRRMQCFLKDADAKRKGDERVRNWVRDVRDVAYDAEDVIDNFIIKMAKFRRGGLASNLLRCSCFFSELTIRHETANEIERIRRKMREISESRSNYGIENLGSIGEGARYTSESLRDRRRSSPLGGEPDVIGFDEDVKMLIKRLKEPETPLRVISVVGMGGIGKTTLAKKVYKSDDVGRHFTFRVWVCVSQEYCVRELLQEIGKKTGLQQKDDIAKMNEGDLKEKLIQFLTERRYLIVMDDIWRTDVWERIREAFPDVKNGSRIIFTTRIKDVALHADPGSPPHELRFLDEDESWRLFSKKVFPVVGNHVVESCSEEMERLGRQIVAKCGGLPLAIVVLGGLLSRKDKTPNGWLKVLASVGWELKRDPAQFSEILGLSYSDLPYYLKSCFLYFGVFPEDAEIKVKKLIQMWVAEGFIQQGDQGKTMEEVGDDYLEELLDRSMIQVSQRRSDGGPKRCRIHDLLRDLAISECKEDQFLHIQIDVGFSSLPKPRRIAIHGGFRRYISLIQSTPHLRSFISYTRYLERPRTIELKFLCVRFKLLRVLNLVLDHHVPRSYVNLPDEIGELIHLRFLRLMMIDLDRLPSSIGNLENLRTLDIRSVDCPLPNAIWKMKQLRHLCLLPSAIWIGRKMKWPRHLCMHFEKMKWPRHLCMHLEKMKGPQRVDFLANLQTLSIRADRWIEHLGKLTNLRKLGVYGYLSYYGKGISDSIAHLSALRSLWLEAEEGDTLPAFPMLSHHLHLYKIRLVGCLEKLPAWSIFPPNLTRLSLRGSKLKQDSMATLERLPNLQILRLLFNSYVGKEMVCYTGGFPRLEVLQLVDLHEVEEMLVEQGSMPSLRCLLIDFCSKLKMVPEGLQHVKTLHELTLYSMGTKFNSRLQENEGEDWHKIQHIRSISIN